MVAVLSHIGTDLIIAGDLSPARLELARTMGAHKVLAMGEGSPEQRQLALQDMTAGVGADIVIETAAYP